MTISGPAVQAFLRLVGISALGALLVSCSRGVERNESAPTAPDRRKAARIVAQYDTYPEAYDACSDQFDIGFLEDDDLCTEAAEARFGEDGGRVGDDEARNLKLVSKLEREMKLGFSVASWYPLIKEYKLKGNDVIIRTAPFPDSEAGGIAKTICGAAINTDAGRQIGTVVIRGKAFSTPASCYLDGRLPKYNVNL